VGLNVRLILIVALDTFAKTKNVSKLLIHVTPAPVVLEPFPLRKAILDALVHVHLATLGILMSHAQRANVNVMKSAPTKRLVKTTTVSTLASLKLAKKTTFVK